MAEDESDVNKENIGEVKEEENVSSEKVSSKEVNKFRENPWIVSTIVLGIVLILVVAFGGVGYQGGGKGVSGSIVSEDVAASNLVSFIESQSQAGVEGDIEVVSSERDGELYKVTLNFQGQEVPVYVSLDGQYLIADVIPLDPSLLPSLPSGAGGSQTKVEVEIGDSPSKGDANVPVTIVEFSDYQCPFCAKFWRETLSQIEETFIDTGIARLVYKDFPLNIHPEAPKAAEAARCVGAQLGDEGYFEMHDLLFAGQAELSLGNYKEWARSIDGVDGNKFDECLDSGEFTEAVLDDFAYGQSLGVQGTPAFFINGKLISGAQPYEVFEQLIVAAIGFA